MLLAVSIVPVGDGDGVIAPGLTVVPGLAVTPGEGVGVLL